jgi:hypothetical protein
MYRDIYLYTLCYYICCLLWRMYEMNLALFLKAGCYTPPLRSGLLSPYAGAYGTCPDGNYLARLWCGLGFYPHGCTW